MFDVVPVQSQFGLDFGITLIEHFFDLPMAVLEIVQDYTKFGTHGARIERDNVTGQFLDPLKIGARCLPCQMKGPDDDARRVGMKPHLMLKQIDHD